MKVGDRVIAKTSLTDGIKNHFKKGDIFTISKVVGRLFRGQHEVELEGLSGTWTIGFYFDLMQGKELHSLIKEILYGQTSTISYKTTEI